jgi:hypothetical protein
MLEKHGENLEGLILKTDAKAMFAQLTRAKIRFKDPKAGRPWQMVGFGH